ncbi:hypothetical protein AKO1_007679 [Acrasis kona]|uniref:Orc1-like AAA ATPase domain-containing protein n=1 Tax=Acrasis kona TaxID=1008807 RepID=A0AAW2YPQ2_9EUKA
MFRTLLGAGRRKFIQTKTFRRYSKKETPKEAINDVQQSIQKIATILSAVGYGVLNAYYAYDQYRDLPRVIEAIENGPNVEDTCDMKIVDKKVDSIRRDEQVNELKKLLKASKDHNSLISVIVGYQGVGKSSLIREAIHSLKDRRRIVLIKFDDNHSSGENTVVEQIAQAVNYTPFVPQEVKSNFSYWLSKISFSHTDREQSLSEMFNILSSICSQLKEKDPSQTPLFIFDNVNCIAQNSPKDLKSMMGFAKKGAIQGDWSVIFLCDKSQSDILYSASGSHYISSHVVTVDDVSESDVKDYIMRQMTFNKINVTPEQIDRITSRVTGGHLATVHRVVEDLKMLQHKGEPINNFAQSEVDSGSSTLSKFAYYKRDSDVLTLSVWDLLFDICRHPDKKLDEGEAWNILNRRLDCKHVTDELMSELQKIDILKDAGGISIKKRIVQSYVEDLMNK